jgi:hypothetical protein
MQTQVKRRYTIRDPEYKVYTDRFDRLLILSDILNANKSATGRYTMYDKRAIEVAISEREEKTIPDFQRNLDDAQIDFESYCSNRVNGGYALPTAWPKHLLERRLHAEVGLDITNRELEVLKDQLETRFIQPIKEAEEKNMLAFGPIGTAVLQNGVIALIDGQAVERIDGVLVIVSEKSPYRGLAISDYREHVVKPFVIARRKHDEELVKKRAEELRTTGKSNISITNSHKKIHSSSLPPLPDGVPLYSIEVSNNSHKEEPSLRRNKIKSGTVKKK